VNSLASDVIPKTSGGLAPQGRFAQRDFWLRVLLVVGLMFVFLVGVGGLSSGFKGLGKGVLNDFFKTASNPFVGLVLGILATTLVQSSSATTTLIVGLVGTGQLGVPAAIPMIMGANIGTTVTNSIVALGHMSRPAEFRRAFAAATCHDFFNFLTVAVLLPLEIATGILQKMSHELTLLLADSSGAKFPNPVKDATKAAIKPVKNLFAYITDSKQAQSLLLIGFAAIVIFSTLYLITKVLRAITASQSEGFISRALGKSAALGVVVGVIVTVMVQSSSITTSTLIPLAGAGLITLEMVFPITVGANIGTTVTALLASLAVPGEGFQLGLQIALVHLLFNLAGVLFFFIPQTTRQLPLRAARWLADVAVDSKKWALLYIVGLFYGVPAALIGISKLF